MRHFLFFLALSGITAYSILDGGTANAQSFAVQQFQRKLMVGLGKAPSIGTVRYPQAIKDGETIVMFADGFDADGDDVFVEWYVNGKLFTIQSERPYGVRVGPDVYGHLPARVTVAVRNDYGDSSVAKLAITSSSFAKSYSCDFVSADESSNGITATATQVGNSGITISFENSKITASSSLTVSGTTATGTITYSNGSTSTTEDVSGSVTFDDDGLIVKTISVKNEDSSVTLSCS